MPKLKADLQLFDKTHKATFIKRVNRFVVECAVNDEVIGAYLPNPGRLRELLLPGRVLYLAENLDTPERKYRYTAVAVEREAIPVLLHTHRSNDVVRWLIEKGKIPGFEDAEVVKPEATVGRSRFDFLLMRKGRPFLLEVKSCTLFGKTIAMFPDAVTERGKRHLIELAEQSRKGTKAGVIFLVHWPHARWFLPDYHTDIEFARTLYEARNEIMVKALSIGWHLDLSLSPAIGEITIPWHIVESEAKDSGSYILILHLTKDASIEVGKLGFLSFQKGYYLYVGSAKRNLKKRMARHMRRRKNPFWHIDYLREEADTCIPIPVRSSAPLQCCMAKRLGEIADWSVSDFGSSDCQCDTHLFGMQAHPLENVRFIEMIQHFRIDRLENLLSA
jgi:sugar fermentation stimulation protein A